MMYQIVIDPVKNTAYSNMVLRTTDNAYLMLHNDSYEYQQFKKDIQNGVVLNDAEGNPITGSDLTTFIGTLP